MRAQITSKYQADD
jgi:hypothetical protein